MTVLKILGIIVFAAFALVACGALLLMIHLHKLYNKRKCKYCGHYMTYRGAREEKGEDICVFHCEHCGAWENVPKTEVERFN